MAFKKVPYVDESGNHVQPSEPNAYKAEMFIFDMFAHARNLQVLSVDRESEFAPLKNASGSKSDCPETCRSALLSLHKKYLIDAGAKVEGDSGLFVVCCLLFCFVLFCFVSLFLQLMILFSSSEIEISPLLSYDGEGLEHLKGKTFSGKQLITK